MRWGTCIGMITNLGSSGLTNPHPKQLIAWTGSIKSFTQPQVIVLHQQVSGIILQKQMLTCRGFPLEEQLYC